MTVSMVSLLISVAALAAHVIPAHADPNDWVNIQYVIGQSKASASSRSATIGAQNSIISGAKTTAKKGPWSVTNSEGYTPPSGDVHDYLSWAPYHWPDCNWCSNGRTHLANPNSTDDEGPPDADNPPDTDDPYPDGGLDSLETDVDLSIHLPAYHRRMHKRRRATFEDRSTTEDGDLTDCSEDENLSTGSSQTLLGSSTVLSSSIMLSSTQDSPLQIPALAVRQHLATDLPPVPTILTPALSPSSTAPPQSTNTGVYGGTSSIAQAAAKTKKNKASCTPSPTSSLAPSATWTTCPYVVRDGQVNPDVRKLNGPPAINCASQSIVYNAIAFVLDPSSSYAQNVAKFVDAFFLTPATRMNPNMNFGQVVRGPGKEGRTGTFTGILDLRGIVKIVNGIMALRGVSNGWTKDRDAKLMSWMQTYSEWLEGSNIGKATASRANNHNTFYVSQLAAIKTFLSDNTGAAKVLQGYFSNQFLDQVAASGEQPFEAVRTRPFHYRCFNLEAMITNAKLGDQLGLNLWTAKSKYGATIQTAVDYTMGVNPKQEDVKELVPHVASIAAAYGDPKGKYAAFLRKNQGNYQTRPFWFYDQTVAMPNSPAAKSQKRSASFAWVRKDRISPEEMQDPVSSSKVPFVCPMVFDDDVNEVEIDDGIYVTCDQLRPFYEQTAIPASESV